MSAAHTWHRQGEADHLLAVKRANHLTAYFFRDDKQAKRDQLRIGKIPDFFLQRDRRAQLIQIVAIANEKGVAAHDWDFSCCFACRHRFSSSSTEAPSRGRPVS